MEAKTLNASLRTETGSNLVHKLRKQDLLPGIIYGHGKDPIPFTVNRHEVEVELLHGQRLLSLDLEGKQESFLIKDLQFDHLGSELQHLDLMRVNLNETINVSIQIVLRGNPIGSKEGGVLDQKLSEVDVECLASNIPNEIRANVSSLAVGDSLTVADLELQEGVKLLAPASDLVAMVSVVAEETPEETEEETKEAEPEIITKGKAEEDTEKES